MIDFASEYFKKPIARDDIVWTYSGVRPLYDDGASSASAATRDYVLTVDDTGGLPVLNIFGGKITTYRELAEDVLGKITSVVENSHGEWTAGATLPGGDFPVDGVAALMADLRDAYPFLTEAWVRRFVQTYGTLTRAVLGDATEVADLGEDFGAGIHARELDWAMAHEWVRTSEDFIWRRTKLGLRLTPEQTARIDAYITEVVAAQTG